MWWMAAAMAAPLTVGVVVDPDNAYVMTDEGVVATRAIGGETLWKNASVLAPLEAHGDRVLALGADSRALVLLDRADGREVTRCPAIPAPDWAGALGQTATTSYQVRGSWDGDAFVAGWYAGTMAGGTGVPVLIERLAVSGRVRCRPDGSGEALDPAGDEGSWVGTAPPPPAGAPVDPSWTWSGVSYDGKYVAGVVEGKSGVVLHDMEGRALPPLHNAPWGKAFGMIGGRYVTVHVDEQGQASLVGHAFDRASPLVWRIAIKDLQFRGPYPPGTPPGR